MNTNETIEVLRWIASNDELLFNAKQANDAADLIEQLQAGLDARTQELTKTRRALCALCRDIAKRDGNLPGCYSRHFKPTSIAGGNDNG